MIRKKITSRLWAWTVPVLLVMATWSMRPSSAAEKNLVYNGSFEVREPGELHRNIDTVTPDREDLVAWAVTGKSVDWIGPERWKASHGKYCLDIDAPGGVLTQIRTTPGKTYRLTFDMAGNVEIPPSKKNLTVSIDDRKHQFTFDAAGHTRSRLGWVRREVIFTATKKSTTLAFTNASKKPTASGIALDNVVVTLVMKKGK